MTEEVFDPNETQPRTKEKVRLSSGKILWVWDLEAADWLRGTERAIIRAGPMVGQLSYTDSTVWKVLASCYTSDAPDAKRIFDEENMLRIYRLSSKDFQLITAAIDRVNGTDPETTDAIEAFTPLRGEELIGT